MKDLKKYWYMSLSNSLENSHIKQLNHMNITLYKNILWLIDQLCILQGRMS